jgi:hypothetical protein
VAKGSSRNNLGPPGGWVGGLIDRETRARGKYLVACTLPPTRRDASGRLVRPNGPGDRSLGLRPQADALGGEIDNAVRPERPRNRWFLEVATMSLSASVRARRNTPCKFSRPFRPQGWGALFPRASAFGLSPGLGSPGPLGRWRGFPRCQYPRSSGSFASRFCWVAGSVRSVSRRSFHGAV